MLFLHWLNNPETRVHNSFNALLLIYLYGSNEFIKDYHSRNNNGYVAISVLSSMLFYEIDQRFSESHNSSQLSYFRICSAALAIATTSAISNRLALSSSSLAFIIHGVINVCKYWSKDDKNNSIENVSLKLIPTAITLYYMKSEFDFMCQQMQTVSADCFPSVMRYLINPLPTGVQPWVGTALGSIAILAIIPMVEKIIVPTVESAIPVAREMLKSTAEVVSTFGRFF
jgi:hypothetical protein